MEIKQLLNKYGFYFKKAFGQNFLTDEALLDEIVTLSGVQKDDKVIEIGSGAGTLTRAIAKQAGSVTGYEIDLNLREILADSLEDFDNVNIVFKDVMKVSMAEIEKGLESGYTVVANLPYYITTPILMRFIEDAKYVKKLVLTVQKEVAERFSAKENTSDYGSITAAINLVGYAKTVKIIGREMFTPAPNVDSAVVVIDIDRDKFKGVDKLCYREVLKCAFGNRRKTLCNNIMQTFKLSRDVVETALTDLGIDKLSRGETLSAESFVKLTDKLLSLGVVFAKSKKAGK